MYLKNQLTELLNWMEFQKESEMTFFVGAGFG